MIAQWHRWLVSVETSYNIKREEITRLEKEFRDLVATEDTQIRRSKVKQQAERFLRDNKITLDEFNNSLSK